MNDHLLFIVEPNLKYNYKIPAKGNREFLLNIWFNMSSIMYKLPHNCIAYIEDNTGFAFSVEWYVSIPREPTLTIHNLYFESYEHYCKLLLELS